MGLSLTAVGVLAVYVLEIEMNDTELLFVKSIMYLSGLSTIYLGWKKMEHKFPDKRH